MHNQHASCIVIILFARVGRKRQSLVQKKIKSHCKRFKYTFCRVSGQSIRSMHQDVSEPLLSFWVPASSGFVDSDSEVSRFSADPSSASRHSRLVCPTLLKSDSRTASSRSSLTFSRTGSGMSVSNSRFGSLEVGGLWRIGFVLLAISREWVDVGALESKWRFKETWFGLSRLNRTGCERLMFASVPWSLLDASCFLYPSAG